MTAPALVAGIALAGCGPSQDPIAAHEGTVSGFCLDCHNDIEQVANLSLEGLDLAAVANDAPTWEKVVRKLRAGMMPPAGGPRPTREASAELAAWVESEIDRAAEAAPNPGRTVPFHRLNRSEYRNAIRDLLALDLDVADLLPADDASYGFDNIAGVLKVSPTLLERYLGAADRVSRLAVGLPAPFENIDYFRMPDDRSQERRMPGLPFGTRGGTAIDYNFPVDAEYVIAAELARDLNESMPLYAEAQHLEVSIDGERVALFTLPGVPVTQPDGDEDSGLVNDEISQIKSLFNLSREERQTRNRADEDWQVRVPVEAGPHEVTVTFIAKTAALDETARLPFLRPYPAGVNIPETRMGAYLRSVEISGPYGLESESHTSPPTGEDGYGSSGAVMSTASVARRASTASVARRAFATGTQGTSPSRERIFVCRPDDAAASNLSCATEILTTLARRAYRRPITETDVAPLLEFYDQGQREGGFEAGIQLALKRLLVSPGFLFRIERDPPDAAPGTLYEVDAFELASRLSFFLWSSIPDDELLAAAAEGRLANEAGLRSEVERMLADSRADAFVENFAGQWLFLRNLDAIVPVQSNFPDFDDTLRQGLRRETELFFASIVREDRSALDLLRADYTFLNERVAKHYGVPGIKGAHFRRVQWSTDDPRRGLLGHGSILAVTSYPDRTSPVIRGKWILENLLGTPPPAPPPDVPGLVETDGAGTMLAMRERLAVHRADPNCASCHALMDPLGFALENFDAVGRWRTLGDAGEPIDASGELPDGTRFEGVDGLRQALLSSDMFLTTMTEKLMTYALGRGVEHYDMPAVREIVRQAAEDDYRLSAFIMGVVESPAFRMRRTAGEEIG